MTDLQIGAIDGAAELTTRGFEVVLDDSATVQLDDLIVTRQTLPVWRGGRPLRDRDRADGPH